MNLQAFVARRLITSEGIRPAAILVEGEQIQAVVSPNQIPDHYKIHDFGEASLFISRIAPVAMLFIPCRNGYSHRPDEYASPEDIVRGTLILAETLAALSQ